MPNWLLDGLSDVGYALDTPGAYLRGALAGRPGNRASGEDLLSSYGVRGGPLGGLAAEMVVDPLTLLPPLYGAYRGAKALSGAGDLAPLMRRLDEFAPARGLDARLGELGSQLDPVDRLRYGYRDTVGKANPLGDAIRGLGDETGALNLKFDGFPDAESVGFNRADPEWVNNRTFYHGTGTPGLAAGDLDPYVTRAEGLFGKGIYTTDSPSIVQGYARARSKRGGEPTIYEAQSDFGRIADLDRPPTTDLSGPILEAAKGLEDWSPGWDVSDDLRALLSRGGTGAEMWRALSHNVSDLSHSEMIPSYEFDDLFAELADRLRGGGIDALTHTGGLRTNAGRAHGPHQVVIGLDPNDRANLGRSTPYRIWQPLADLLGDETGAASPGTLLGKLGSMFRESPLDRRLGELGSQLDPMDRLRYGYRETAGKANPLERAMGEVRGGFLGDEAGAVVMPDFGDDPFLAALKMHRDHPSYANALHEDAILAIRKNAPAHWKAHPDVWGGYRQDKVETIRKWLDKTTGASRDQLGEDILYHHTSGTGNYGHANRSHVGELGNTEEELRSFTHPDNLANAMSSRFTNRKATLTDRAQGALDRSAVELRASDPAVARDWLTEGFADDMIGSYLDRAAKQFAGYETVDAAADLPRRFLVPPSSRPRGTEGLDWLPKFANQVRQARQAGKDYYSHLYYELNHALRSGGTQSPKVQEMIRGLDQLMEMSRVPEEMALYRGVDAPGLAAIEQLLGVPLSSPEAVGRSFVDPAYLSTSYDPHRALQFAGLEGGYNRPSSGARFAFGDVGPGSRASLMNADEAEVLWPRGRRITIRDNSGFPRDIVAEIDPMDRLRADYRATTGKANPLGEAIRGLGGEEGHLDLDAFAGLFGGDRRAAEVAAVQGPGYPGGADKLADILRGKVGAGIQDSLLGDPLAAKYIASEIPEGSSFLGKGGHGVAFRTPQDSVVRVSARAGERPVQRYAIPEILQPFRSVYKGGHTVEHVPLVRPLDGLVDEDLRLDDIMARLNIDDARKLYPLLEDRIAVQDAAHKAHKGAVAGLSRRGFEDHDWDLKNVGLTAEGRLVAHDPGVVFQDTISRLTSGEAPTAPVLSTAESTPFRNEARRRSEAVGGPGYIRDVLEQDAAAGTLGQGVPSPALDAVRPAMDRLTEFLSRFPAGMRLDREAVEAIFRQYRGG